MGVRSAWRALCFAVPAASLLVSSGAAADVDEGWWNIEAAGSAVLDKADAQREGDLYVTGSVDYEWPLTARASFGLRAYPLFLYREDHRGAVMYGAALGVVFRFYEKPGKMLGWYGEAGSAAIWHSRHFVENSSRVNFLTEAGLGYRFDATWRVALKYRHISNAGLGEDNTDNDAIAVAIGYSF